MTKKERNLLIDCINDIRNSDDEIEPLTRLYSVVKNILQIK